MSFYPIILAGGKGSRVASWLRTNRPKQFVKLPKCNNSTIFDLTYNRIKLSSKLTCKPLVSSNINYYEFLMENHSLSDFSGAILEACPNNTAFAVTTAAINIYNRDRDATCIFFPSDHIFKDEIKFIESIDLLLEQNLTTIVTVVVKAPYINPLYGNVFVDKDLVPNQITAVQNFIEKPQQEHHVNALYWNTGIICFQARQFLKLLKLRSPTHYNICYKAVEEAKNYGKVTTIPKVKTQYLPVEKIMLEDNNNICAWNIDTEWQDLGHIDNLKQYLTFNHSE